MGKKPANVVDYQLYPLGDSAVVLQFGEAIKQPTHRRITALSTYLTQHAFPGFVELVPAYTTITVYYDPWIVSEKGMINPYQKVVETLQQQLTNAPNGTIKYTSRVVEIPVCYGGIFGPDLEYVAEQNKLSIEEVVELHASGKYTVYMIGFAPGFPYLGGLSKKIATPRRQTPRTTIPAGSVGIAGTQTGVYPMQTPGGWQLIGRTPISLFNPERGSPSLLQAGDTVKFIPVTAEEYKQREEQEI